MIEQLGEHGVTAGDLVPSLVTTHTVPNPEYDPKAEFEQEKAAALEASRYEQHENASRAAGIAVESDLAQVADSHPTAPPPYSPISANSKRMQTSANDQKPSTDGQGDEKDADLPTSPGSIHDSPVPSSLSNSPDPDNLVNPLPSALPGVSTTLTAADKTITLDIRWTILCDLFLALIADSVYDARSRVLLGQIADRLGLTWADVVRFERRLTDALELQEGMAKRENMDVLELRKQADKKKRYMMMGLATLGGGLVIGLSAGLLAPVIGAGLGAAFATVGVSGTGAFLGGAGGAAVITTGGVLTGSHIGGKGMARRTQAVETFDFVPLHNNKRLSTFVTIPG